VSVHVVGDYTSEKERMELKDRVEVLLLERFHFSQSTIETECGQVCPVDESGLVHAFFHEDEV
jgi:hypothetical protein